jgi:hypothetical protein
MIWIAIKWYGIKESVRQNIVIYTGLLGGFFGLVWLGNVTIVPKLVPMFEAILIRHQLSQWFLGVLLAGQ